MPRLVKRYADQFVAYAYRFIPGAVLRCKDVALIFCRELLALVEGQLKRGIMRLQDDVWSKDLFPELGMFALMSRVLVAAHIPPRPAVEPPVLHVGDVVRDQVIAECVALVHRAPECAGLRIDGEPASGIANAIGVDPHARTVGAIFQDIGAILLIP